MLPRSESIARDRLGVLSGSLEVTHEVDPHRRHRYRIARARMGGRTSADATTRLRADCQRARRRAGCGADSQRGLRRRASAVENDEQADLAIGQLSRLSAKM